LKFDKFTYDSFLNEKSIDGLEIMAVESLVAHRSHILSRREKELRGT
jgi:hypothetical protein